MTIDQNVFFCLLNSFVQPLNGVKYAYLRELQGMLLNINAIYFYTLNEKFDIYLLFVVCLTDVFSCKTELERDLIDKLHSLHDSTMLINNNDKNNITNVRVDWQPLNMNDQKSDPNILSNYQFKLDATDSKSNSDSLLSTNPNLLDIASNNHIHLSIHHNHSLLYHC